MLTAPFPYFGGKRIAAPTVWSRLGGDLTAYAEPFAGSAAVFLARPGGCPTKGVEVLGDADGLLVNVWRAIQRDPDGVARHCDDPPHEATLKARHRWIRSRTAHICEHVETDPDWYDVRAAGVWVWGMSASVADGWHQRADGGVVLNNHHPGILHKDAGETLRALSRRLRHAHILCGHWSRTLTPSRVLPGTQSANSHRVGVFLDPPYDADCCDPYTHGVRAGLLDDVQAWALEHGDDPRFRIVVAGYSGMYPRLDAAGWQVEAWKASGGYGSQADGQGRANAQRERLWCSPHTLSPPRQTDLWSC